MSDIYIPIDYSNAKEKIPPGEDIIYSTLMKVTSGSTGIGKKKWISHVLMTPNGISYTKPARKSSIVVKYHPWNGIYGIFRKQFQIGGTYFKLERNPDYESKENFKMRTKTFTSTIKPIKKAYKENRKSKK